MNIALLTGRGGSESIRDKNIMPVLGRPLMIYPFLAAKHSREIDEVFLSTDGEKLKDVGREYGMKIIDRPPELARPESQHVDCLTHALKWFHQEGMEVEILVVLLCNVATHDIGTIDHCIEILRSHPRADACVTITQRNEHSPLIAKQRDSRNDLPPLQVPAGSQCHYLRPCVPEHYQLPQTRQSLPPSYFLTHALWALRVDTCFQQGGQPPWDFMGRNIIGVKVDGGTDIHDSGDVSYSEAWLRRHGWSEHHVPLKETDND